jgi:hypothetical protein
LTIYFVVVYLLPLSGLISPVSIPSKLAFEVIISIYPVLMGGLLVCGKISSEQMLIAVLDDDLVSVHVGDYVIATCCLDIISAPGSVLVARNDRPEYATAFLLALRAGMDNKVSMAYEAGVWGGEVFLRIFITGSGKSMQEVGNTLRREATRTEAILLSALNNVELHQLRGDDLSEAVSGILSLDLEGGSELLSEEMHTALLLITGEPRVSPSLESSQIGTFISTSLRQGYNVSFTCVFSKAKPGREQRKLEGHWKTIRDKEKRNEDSLADQSEKKKLLRSYEEIQGNTGWFDSSVSLAIRADTPDQLSSTQEGVAGIVQSIWGGEGVIKLKQKSIGRRAVYKLLLRRHIASQRIHVSRLAAFLNTPVQQLPVITASPVPSFSIPSKEFAKNELIIGKAVFGGHRLNDVGLRPEWLREHVAVMGATGTGKTTLVKHLIAELSTKSSVPWWIFDVKGSEYCELVDLCDNDILVLKPGADPSFVIDFMDPEIDSGERHAHTTFAILKELLNERGVSSELSPAMEKLLREAVLEIARSSDNGNSIQALTQAVSELAGKDRTGTMTRDALLNRLEILSREPLGTILSGGREAIRISNLIDKRVILDLQHVARTGGMEAARLLYNLIAKRIFDCALHRGIRPGLHHLVVLEEASNLVPESYTRHTAADVTTGESMVMLQRATGQGVIIISTRPNVSSNILANTATKITFRLPYDSPIGARFMSLDEKQERYLKTLKRGRALIVLPGSEPFEIATRPFKMASVLEKPFESLTHDESESEDDRESSLEYDMEAQSRRVSASKPIGAVYDRLGELGSHVVAFLAARSMGTQAEIQGILTSIDPRIEGDDISEVIRDLVSLGTIEREALSLVPGDFIFTLPGKGLDAVRTVITDYIIEKLGLLDTTWERNSDEGPDIIIDDRAILIIPQHLKASSMKTTLSKIRNYMNNLGNNVIELVVIVRGSVAAARLREVMDETNEFDAVSIVSAFPSSLETMIENLVNGASTNVDLTTNDEEVCQDDAGVNLIGAMHDVGTATNRAIQMRLWFQLIQDFVDLSNGRTEWDVLLEFIETTALQSLKGKSTPMNVEEGKRALTELLADEVLMALRVGNDLDFTDLDEGLWIVNSGELGKLKDFAVDALEQELQKRQSSVSRNHGYYDLCTNGISYVVFPNQQQLNTLVHLQSDIACRTCKSEQIVCVLTAAEYLEDTVVMPDNILLYDFSEYVSVASTAGH